ncbi:MAG: hypothetical protein U0905_10945 [Pirellulales bacterium]
MELLASAFGVDVLNYAVMSNHVHSILRTRPDIVKLWSDEDVATRWLRLFPGKRLDDCLGVLNATADRERDGRCQANAGTSQAIVEYFLVHASSLGAYSRKANNEDKCTGRFWEGRFKAQKIVDEAGALGLRCMSI